MRCSLPHLPQLGEVKKMTHNPSPATNQLPWYNQLTTRLSCFHFSRIPINTTAQTIVLMLTQVGLWKPSSFIIGPQQMPDISKQVFVNTRSSLSDGDRMGWDVTTAVWVMHLLQDPAWYLTDTTNDYDSGTTCHSAVCEMRQGVQQQGNVRIPLSRALHTHDMKQWF